MRMGIERYLRELQAPYDWQLEPGEKQTAILLAHQYGARAVIAGWHRFQAANPLSNMEEFQAWFTAERAQGEAVADRTRREESPLRDFWEKTGKL